MDAQQSHDVTPQNDPQEIVRLHALLQRALPFVSAGADESNYNCAAASELFQEIRHEVTS